MFTNGQVRILETIAKGLGAKDERERIIKSLDIERTGSHALDDLIDTLIFMNISRSDFKRGLLELIKGETE